MKVSNSFTFSTPANAQIAEVRAKAADIAVAAAKEILAAKVKDKVADDILTKSIAQVKERLN